MNSYTLPLRLNLFKFTLKYLWIFPSKTGIMPEGLVLRRSRVNDTVDQNQSLLRTVRPRVASKYQGRVLLCSWLGLLKLLGHILGILLPSEIPVHSTSFPNFVIGSQSFYSQRTTGISVQINELCPNPEPQERKQKQKYPVISMQDTYIREIK